METSKAFWLQFSHRNQKYGETVEEYAADLKKLYDKAHVRRDRETRREDLLRRLLDGLADDKARFHVEFIKEPNDIDNAVFQVVCFQQTKQTNRNTDPSHFRSLTDTCNNSDSDSEGKSVARAAPGKNKDRIIQHTAKTETSTGNGHMKKEAFDLDKLRDIVRTELQAISATTLSAPNQYKDKVGQFHTSQNYQPGYRPSNNGRYQQQYNNTGSRRGCYLCGDMSHFKANCPQNRYKRPQPPCENNNHNSNGQDLNDKGLASQA